MQQSYQTKQREAVLKCLSSHNGESISAKEIFAICEKNNTPVGLATIYRQLEKFIAENKVKRITADDNTGIRFQYINEEDSKDAFFLKCDGCGKMTHTDCDVLNKVINHMKVEHEFQINTFKSVFYGRCKECI